MSLNRLKQGVFILWRDGFETGLSQTGTRLRFSDNGSCRPGGDCRRHRIRGRCRNSDRCSWHGQCAHTRWVRAESACGFADICAPPRARPRVTDEIGGRGRRGGWVFQTHISRRRPAGRGAQDQPRTHRPFARRTQKAAAHFPNGQTTGVSSVAISQVSSAMAAPIRR